MPKKYVTVFSLALAFGLGVLVGVLGSGGIDTGPGKAEAYTNACDRIMYVQSCWNTTDGGPIKAKAVVGTDAKISRVVKTRSKFFRVEFSEPFK